MRLKKRFFTQPIVLFFVATLLSVSLQAQKPARYNGAELKQMLKKLNVLGSVMYIAAHPDDENTQMIAYMANERLYQTAYMACTRGDGGQNLIGPEIRELLGLIRTQELLAARRTDGGQQFFSRANDFGYSKNPEETFQIWDREKVLSDMIWNIRKFRPDVLITRFPPDGQSHGHHTASAILAVEAFKAAADPKRFPEQLKYVTTWQPKRILWNTSRWFYANPGEYDSKDWIAVDVGAYSTLLGKSYTELSAESRSMHKSQGFGATGSRGTNVEYLQHLGGEAAKEDVMEGVETTWRRVKGGDKVAFHTENAFINFDPENPTLILPDLMQAYQALNGISDVYWREVKQEEIKTLIKGITGLFLEARANEYAVTPGDSIKVNFEVINRSPATLVLKALVVNALNDRVSLDQKLENNQGFQLEKSFVIPSSMAYSQPYWLRKEGTIGMYAVDDQLMRGLPENPPAVMVNYVVAVDGLELDLEMPLIFKRNDRVDGEVYRPFVVTPPVFADINEKVYVFADSEPRTVQVTVKSGKANIEGSVALSLPKGWESKPASQPFNLAVKGASQVFEFSVTPPKKQGTGIVTAVATVSGKTYSKGLIEINYAHIPVQTLFPESSAQVVRIDLEKKGQLVGYLMGPGDEIPASLRQIGYTVDELTVEDVASKDLQKYDAIILGVRAFNTMDQLKYENEKLFKYTENGGTVIVQYLTSGGMVTDKIAPYPIKIGRDRVTVEEAPVRFLDEKSEVLSYPNKITEKDFEGWVQERGLYFASEWDDHFKPVLSSNDPGEEPLSGGLLVAQYGKGYYVYTGYSWFRELPAGVPGAYRLFTNLISLGKK